MDKKKLVIGITGASGAIYASLLLRRLSELKDQIEECGLVLTENAKEVWEYELGNRDYLDIQFPMFAQDDFYAPFASGSAGYDAMIICPCSMASLAKIANGISTDLLTRSADVMLKERKKILLVVREMPFSSIHLKNMQAVTEAGAIVCPASPSYYSFPENIDQLALTVVDKTLQLAGFNTGSFRWGKKASK